VKTGSTRRGAVSALVLTAAVGGCAAPQDTPGPPAWSSRSWVDYALIDGLAPRDGAFVSNAPRGEAP